MKYALRKHCVLVIFYRIRAQNMFLNVARFGIFYLPENEIIWRLLWKPAAVWLKSLLFPFRAYSITSFPFCLKFIDLEAVIFLHYLVLDAESISQMSSIALQILDVSKNFFLSFGLICLPVSSERKGILTL